MATSGPTRPSTDPGSDSPSRAGSGGTRPRPRYGGDSAVSADRASFGARMERRRSRSVRVPSMRRPDSHPRRTSTWAARATTTRCRTTASCAGNGSPADRAGVGSSERAARRTPAWKGSRREPFRARAPPDSGPTSPPFRAGPAAGQEVASSSGEAVRRCARRGAPARASAPPRGHRSARGPREALRPARRVSGRRRMAPRPLPCPARRARRRNLAGRPQFRPSDGERLCRPPGARPFPRSVLRHAAREGEALGLRGLRRRGCR